MNSVAFEIGRSEHARDTGEVRILIDGVDLRLLAEKAELASAAAEGNASLAGSYAGLRADGHVLPPSQHFLGRVESGLYEYGRRVQVLGCECGEPGCWPLVCRVEADKDWVVWSDFERPYRRGAWKHDGLGPFMFARAQFEEALRALRG